MLNDSITPVAPAATSLMHLGFGQEDQSCPACRFGMTVEGWRDGSSAHAAMVSQPRRVVHKLPGDAKFRLDVG